MPITLRRHQFPPYHRRHHHHRCNNPWRLQYLGVPSASSCIAETHQTRCMSLRTCTCKWPAGPRTRAYQILRPPTSCFFGFRRYIRHMLSRRAPANPSVTLTRSATATVSLRVLYMRTGGRHRVDTRGTHLDGGSPVCRARPCRHFHASVADAVYLAIGPGLIQGFKLLPQHGRYEQTALGTHFKAQREPT